MTYVTDTLALVAGKDPIAIISETPSWLHARLATVSDADWRRPEADGKWSLVEVIAHLADTEIAYGWRIRQVLTTENAPLHGFDQGTWLTRFDYAAADPRDAMNVFSALRGWNLRIWRTVTPADLQRTGQHVERGPETLDTVLQLTAGHDLRHRRQIERLLGPASRSV